MLQGFIAIILLFIGISTGEVNWFIASGKEKLLIGNYIINGMPLEVANIKTILTKEQYERNCYRLENN